MMWKRTALVLGLVALSLAESPVEQSSDTDKPNRLPPILGVPDGHEHIQPSLGDAVTEKPADHTPDAPLLGHPGEHVEQPGEGSLLGRKDGHEREPLLGRPNEHEREPLLGRPDEHEQTLIGRPDGHDFEATEDEELDDSEYADAWNENDEDIDWEGEASRDAAYYDAAEEEPLVRCKRPMCDMYCVNGFQTDDAGCPLCSCLDDPCQEKNCEKGYVCRAIDCPRQQSCAKLTAECVVDQPAVYPCAIPMCADDCPTGYQSDARGCMTCRCNVAQPVACPEIDCVERCETGYLRDQQGCMTCTCTDSSPAPAPGRRVCAMPMCSTDCLYGYRVDEDGCMTCDCKEPNCGKENCETGQVCANRIINFSDTPVCVPKSLCNASRDSAGQSRGADYRVSLPACEASGAFRPLQCNGAQSECWCVDDRGTEIDSSRTSVYVEEHKPSCVRNITVAVNIRVLMIIVPDERETDAKPEHLHQLTSTLPEHIGAWMLIDKQYITIVSADEITRSQEHDAVRVEMLVRHDGLTDLPSAIEHMKRRMYMGLCEVPLGNGILAPQPDTLEAEHKFSYTPRQTPMVTYLDDGVYEEHHGFAEYCKDHSEILIVAGVVSALLLLSIIFVSVMISRRRRTHSLLNFEHQRLQNQISTSSEKSLLGSKEDGVLLVSANKVDDRAALA